MVTSGASAAPKANLWTYWDNADPQSTIQIDHSSWQLLLSIYVHENPDRINRVSYKNFSNQHTLLLDSYIQELSAISPTHLKKNSQLAYWINLYNALTVQLVLSHPRKKSIMKMKSSFFSIGPWDDELLTIEGKAVTLNDIEHRILRPIWRDHRLHFALNCASIGCPNLSKTAYTSGNAQALLQKAQSNYLNHPRGLSFVNNKLLLSSIFKWYQVDFSEDEKGLKAYLAAELPQKAQRILSSNDSIAYDYDWDLNEQKSK